MKFLDKVNSKTLNHEITKAAYENCKVAMLCQLIKSRSEEHSLRKNLGSWLGKFTIGRNQALRAQDIDPKSLIIEPYEKGSYDHSNSIYLKVKPTSLLKDQARESEGNLDFSMKDKGASQPQLITGTNTGIMSTSNAVDLKPDIISSTQLGAHLNLVTATFCGGNFSSPIHEIGSHIIFNQKLSALGLQYFERSVPLAIKRAIEEVMGHVVQHNVTIATQTTKDLVLKDYAMESDETPIYNAAHLMIASLAGSLAHVTCKASNISSELQEQAVAIIMNDNLVLCCAVNQHATTDNICFHASITFHIPSPCVHM
ncbi:hypothetical protein RHMOL_Rhmol03G0148400 [Rhododendron molle]|uniref:Uncharacterized protein n=1 Tax=Rhododendron molle TaxID=49168 RepID=A0ACC0PFJ1_RHOML|nr:hypothetical protein RHMOL_Rhmol03G0148400 [Rhododendron molle]